MTVTILHGDALAVLRSLPDGAFQMAVTSPPYFGLRDYGTGRWTGGEPACQHDNGGQRQVPQTKHPGAAGTIVAGGNRGGGRTCIRCGATREDDQIGLEDTPDAYVARLVEVFREVRRTLRDDGTLWLNIGDSYAGSWGAQGKRVTTGQEDWRNSISNHPKMARTGGRARFGEAKPKDLLMIPAMLALALRSDGWWLRSDIIWAKPNPKPESTEDRPTSAHEHVFLLSKREQYFYDGEAIKEEAERTASGNVDRKHGADRGRPGSHLGGSIPWSGVSRQARNVWTIATQPFTAASLPGWTEKHDHFAVMPRDLAERCIRAGTSERGQCPQCGAPWRRVVEKQRLRDGVPIEGTWSASSTGHKIGVSGTGHWRDATVTVTIGWAPSCSCPEHQPIPQSILDPFGGAGTSGLVADRLQRHATLIELHGTNVRLAQARITADNPLTADVCTA